MAPIPRPSDTDQAPAPCELSSEAQALSTILTAWVGILVCSLTNGTDATFFTIWTAWFAPLRVLTVAVYLTTCVVRGERAHGANHFRNFYGMDLNHDSPVPRHLSKWSTIGEEPTKPKSNAPTVWGWIGWAYTVCYSPVIQVLWLCQNWSRAGPQLFWAKATGVAVGALPFTMDTKARYGSSLRRKYGPRYATLFSRLTAAAITILATVAFIELILAASSPECWTYFIVFYVVMSLVWTCGGFAFVVPCDEDTSSNRFAPLLAEVGLGRDLFNLILGVFGGFGAAVPAGMALVLSDSRPGLGLGEYWRCEGVALWQKVVACFP